MEVELTNGNQFKNLIKLILKLDIYNKAYSQVIYNHMGATISDAVLQAGLNYKSVVFPRVSGLIRKYPDYVTTCDFIILFKTKPLSELLSWNNIDKLIRIQDMSWVFFNNKVENEEDLAKWITSQDNVECLKKIKGVGDKTIDYLKKLSGIDSIPIDRHLFKILEYAGIKTENYDYANYLYTQVADELNISKSALDSTIWSYMSRKGNSTQLTFY